MENIVACVRIRPSPPGQNEEVVFDKFEEKSVINLKTRDKYDFGIDFQKLLP